MKPNAVVNRGARRVWPAAAALAALVLLISACSSSGGSASSSPSAATGSAGAATVKIDNSIGAKFAGGAATGSAATGSPITVGWVAQEGGTPSDPEADVALQSAFTYINSELGGIHGHPLVISKCVIVGTDAQGQICGQQFLNNSNVHVIMQVGLNNGNATLHATIGGKKPVLMSEPNPGPDTSAANAVGLTSASISYISSAAAYLKSIHAKKIAMISADGAIDVQIAHGVQATLEKAGLQTKLALFPETGTDLVTPLEAAGATTADAVLPLVVTPASCIAMGNAAKQIGLTKPVIATGLCATDALKKALGDFPEFTYEYSLLNANAPDLTGQVAFFKAVMAKYGGPGAELGLDAPYVFSAAFALAKILDSMSPADLNSSAAISAAMKTFTGPLLLGPPTLKEGSILGFPDLATADGRYYTYHGAGDWTPSGGWISPAS